MRYSMLRAAGTLFVAAYVLSGCATQQPQTAPVSSSHASAAMAPTATAPVAAPALETGPVVIDQRPQSDKVHEIHSLWVTSCDYGIFTLAEKKGGKTHVEALRDDLTSMPGDPWHGHSVTVTHYAAYLNMKRKLKGGVYAMSGGLIPSVMSQMGEACSETQMHGGWYAATDLKTTQPPIVIEIVATVDGKSRSLRSVYSPETAVNPKLKQPSDDAQLAKAIKKANLDFAASLSDHDAEGSAANAPERAADGARPKP